MRFCISFLEETWIVLFSYFWYFIYFLIIFFAQQKLSPIFFILVFKQNFDQVVKLPAYKRKTLVLLGAHGVSWKYYHYLLFIININSWLTGWVGNIITYYSISIILAHEIVIVCCLKKININTRHKKKQPSICVVFGTKITAQYLWYW